MRGCYPHFDDDSPQGSDPGRGSRWPDRRPGAWDAVIADASGQVAIELEMRLVDAQALARRLALKRRDGSVDRIVIVLADTRANRAAYAAARPILESLCPFAARRGHGRAAKRPTPGPWRHPLRAGHDDAL
jgi:hypothetical protein